MFFPVFVDLSEKEILVIGAGVIAQRRIRTLCGFAGHITVIAPVVADGIEKLADGYPVSVIRRGFRMEDLTERNADLVLAATDDTQLNGNIAAHCRRCGIPVNVCSDQSLCDFQFPSVVVEQDMVIGINASGKDHSLVKRVRQEIEYALGSCSRYAAEDCDTEKADTIMKTGNCLEQVERVPDRHDN